MTGEWPLTLGVALALLAVGALVGDRWARLRLPSAPAADRQGRPHYLLGLNYLVSNQPHHAIRELSKAVRLETDAMEAYLALGNLFRENGQTERAIDIHKSLLHRPALSEWERSQVLLSLAMDFKRAGLVDRAERTFREVSQREPDNVGSLHNLREVHVETGDWDEAMRLQRRLQSVSDGSEPDLLPSLEAARGRALTTSDPAAAERHFRAALEKRPDYAPAQVGLGRCLLRRGDLGAALDHLEQAVESAGPWASAALEPMSEACAQLGDTGRLQGAAGRLLERDPRAWRAHLVLARIHQASGDLVSARQLLSEALRQRPASLQVQRQLWSVLESEGEGIEEFVAMLDRALEDFRLIDPFVCLRCQFKSAELFVRCPHCHEWDTMREERQE